MKKRFLDYIDHRGLITGILNGSRELGDTLQRCGFWFIANILMLRLGLFDKYGNFIEARICQSHRDGTFTCPKRTSQPTKRKKLAEKIGVNFQTNQPINKRKK